MALRQIDIYRSQEAQDLPSVEELRETYKIIDDWHFHDEEGTPILRLLVDTKDTQAILDRMVDELDWSDDYRIVISKVAATLPRPGDDDEEDEEDDSPETGDSEESEDDKGKEVSRISREEVYEDVTDSIGVTSVFLTLVFLSTVVAAAGMLRDSTAVVIGAMVIAPLIGPNIALALGTTLADFQLLRRALKINLLGLALVLVVSLVVGLVLDVNVTLDEIAGRTTINIGDVTLALAAGAAGVLSVTRGVSTALIGVMVAVALLPPLTAVGLLLGSAEYDAAYGAALLTVTNLVAINLAGVLTFLFQGIRPTTWYEAEKAKKATIIALVLWVAILALLIATIIVAAPEGL